MREILFRGKSIETKQFIFGDLIQCPVSCKAYIKPCAWEVNESERPHEDGVLTLVTYEVDTETVGQYTGLHDNNGVEIYEGDICEFRSFNCRRVGVVLFSEEKYRYELLQSGDIDWSLEIHEVFDLEVIGNIHEHNHLLG